MVHVQAMADAPQTSRTPSGAGVLASVTKRADIGLALGIMAILAVLILPLPTWLLDISLAFSITFSVLILMTVLFIQKPLEFSSFPAILLISTLLRLSLNLASTRLILSKGHEGTAAAGNVIQAFGNLIMQGNFVIGIIVFAILIIVNFVVITKGSGRIAEVAARFSLDAMPGKQMAIDADLSAGLINENDARERRKELENENTFFGAMDGAAKFVRGDAIAGLLITFINIVGGIIIGTAQMDLSLADAAESYTLLTVGDGLVSQIPALIVSTAAGLLVSKAGVTGSADKAVFGQLGGYPKALAITSCLVIVLGIIPGLPFIPFMMLGVIMGGLAYVMSQQQTAAAEQEEIDKIAEAAEAPVREEPISAALQLDMIRLELGYGLLSLVNDPKGQQKLPDQIKSLRRQLATEMGFIMPSVRIQDNLQLDANSYVVRIKEIESGRGDIKTNMLLVMDPRGEAINLQGEATTEPTFGLPAMWVGEGNREEAMFRGYTVVDPSTVITTHLTEIIKENMSDLLTYAETQKLVDELGDDYQKMVADLIPGQISISNLQRVLQNLLSERVSIRDLPTILEATAEAMGYTKNITFIAEHVRARLARQLCEMNSDDSGVLPILPLSPEWEQVFAESLLGDGEDRQLSMPPSKLQEFIRACQQSLDKVANIGESCVLLTSPAIRPYVRSIVERFRPSTVVMSQNEIHPKAKLKTVGQL